MTDLRGRLLVVADAVLDDIDQSEAVVDAILAHPSMVAIREQAAAYRVDSAVNEDD